MFGAAATLPYEAFYALYDFVLYWPVFCANLVFIATYLSAPLINHHGHANAARNVVVVNIWTQLFVVTYFVTAGAGVHLFYLTIGSALPLISQRYRTHTLLALGILTTMFFVICQLCFSPRTGVSPTPLPIFLAQLFYTGSAVGSISMTALLTYLLRVEIDRTEANLIESNRALEKLSTTDQLTHLLNRRGMDAYLEQEWPRMSREQNTLALVICDVDYFKNYNDSLWPPGGRRHPATAGDRARTRGPAARRLGGAIWR